MTSDFDLLGTLFGLYRDNKLTPSEVIEFEAILNEAVKQASSRKPKKWNFQKWIDNWLGTKKAHNEEYIDNFYGFKNSAKMEFLDDTHSYLDHTDLWHLRVFNRKLSMRLFTFRTQIRERDRTLISY